MPSSHAGGLAHASPKVKEETLAWLRGAVEGLAKPVLAKLVTVLLPPAAKCVGVEMVEGYAEGRMEDD